MSIFKIYLITNTINNKVYIGQTLNSIQERFYRHCKSNYLLGKAIRKYGKGNFSIKIIAECYTQNDADILETNFIREYKSFGYNNQYGYNQTSGGRGFYIFEMWKLKNPDVLCKICNSEIELNFKGHINFCSEKCYKLHCKNKHKERYSRNKTHILKTCKAYQDNNKDIIRERRKAKKDKISNSRKEYYQKNKQIIMERSRERYYSKRLEILAKEKAKNDLDREAYNSRRRQLAKQRRESKSECL